LGNHGWVDGLGCHVYHVDLDTLSRWQPMGNMEHGMPQFRKSHHQLSSTVLTILQFARWEVIGTLDIVTELALFLMAIYLVHGLQMSLKAKAIVVAAFAARVL
jgi:hypothetical protein